MADVRLVDLEVIRRFSLALCQEAAPTDDVLAAPGAGPAPLVNTVPA